ncbi:ELMO domain-containing protein 3 [Biomphalaria glabrata]|nr:ELMO domain-containing protein 3 [Biomphalaria glabrata]
MDDTHYPGVSLNELTFEINEEEFSIKLRPAPDNPNLPCNNAKVNTETFLSQKNENHFTNIHNEQTQLLDFEDCNMEILNQTLLKNRDNDSEFEFDFPETCNPNVTETIDLRPTSFTSVLKIEEKIVPKDEPATESSSNVQVNTYFNQTNIVEYQDNEKKEQESTKMELLTSFADEWDNIQTIQPEILQTDAQPKGSSAEFVSKPLVTFSQIWPQFESLDYSSVKSQIKPTVERQGLSAFLHLLFGPPKLHRDLMHQRDLLFCIAATSFQNDNPIHNQVLQTIYRCLTGSKFDCPRFGNHWEEIGFQGQDPATDLRGGGMLALLNILFLLRDSSTKELSREIYKLSLHPTQNFPFCIMGINLTRICLQVLREEIFNKECNKRKDVIYTINCVYASLFFYLYNKWRTGKTIADSGFILQETELYAHKHPKAVFKDFNLIKNLNKQNSSLDESHEHLTFFSVCNKEAPNDKTAAELY